jgi:hypothetical protein
MSEVDPYAAPEWYDPATLVSRLGGVYTIPITDGLGPIDGKMEFTRDFSKQHPRPQVQLDTAKMIQQLEAGESVATTDIELMIEELKKPADPLGLCGKLFIVPIHCEAIARLKDFLP